MAKCMIDEVWVSEKIKRTVLLVFSPEFLVVPSDEYVEYASDGTP